MYLLFNEMCLLLIEMCWWFRPNCAHFGSVSILHELNPSVRRSEEE